MDNDIIITYGEGNSYDFNAYPKASLVAMLKRGVSHYFGSELASSLQTATEKAITTVEGDEEATKVNKAKLEAMSTTERRATLRTFREANVAWVESKRAELYNEFLADLVAGKVGVSVRGPSVDPLTAVMQRLAKAEVTNILKKEGTKLPKKAEDKVAFPNGDAFTMAELISRRLAKPEHKARIEKDAKKIIADQQKRADQAGTISDL